MKKYIVIFSIFLSFCFVSFLSAQSTTSGLSGTDLANIIAGEGISITNVTLNCPGGSSGSFEDGLLSVIQVDEGVLLTSGNLTGIFGPNNAGNTSIDNGGAGDADLSAASGFSTENACILEFDFVPSANNLSVNYVFASEEYNEWVCTEFNDVFAFFVSGMNPGGPDYINENIALVPGVGSPVTVNSINNGSPGANDDGSACDLSNSAFYNDNTGGTNLLYDGFTTVLTASLALVPCESYHFKFAIADASDALYDSGVFIDAASFSTNNIVATATDSPEGCPGGEITFTSTLPNITGYTIEITVLGSSTASASDYEPFALHYFLDIDSQSLTVPIVSIADILNEGNETIDFEFTYDAGCDPTTSNASIQIIDGPITCEDFILVLGGDGTGSISPDDVLTGNLAAVCPSFLLSLSQEDFVCSDEGDNIVTVTADDGNGNISQCDATVTVVVPPGILTIDLGDACRPVYLGYAPLECTDITASVSGGTPPYQYAWSNGESTQTITVCPVVTTTYTVVVTDSNGCDDISAGAEVEVVDVRCGNKGDKVLVCHIPPGNAPNEHNICVSPNAVPAHLAHGDYLGTCGEFPCDGMLPLPKANVSGLQKPLGEEMMDIQLYPNPTAAGITLRSKNLDVLSIEILDIKGERINSQIQPVKRSGDLFIPAVEQLAPGAYFLRIISSTGEVYMQRFVKIGA